MTLFALLSPYRSRFASALCHEVPVDWPFVEETSPKTPRLAPRTMLMNICVLPHSSRERVATHYFSRLLRKRAKCCYFNKRPQRGEGHQRLRAAITATRYDGRPTTTYNQCPISSNTQQTELGAQFHHFYTSDIASK